MRREIAEGRELGARGDLARGGARALRGRGPAVQGRARAGRRRADLAVHAGRLHRPLPRAAPAGRLPDQGAQADEPRGRVLARRREEHAADADLRHGLLLAGRPRRAPRAARAGPRAGPPPPRHAARPLPLRRALARARRSGTRRGWSIWNALEDLRRRENAKRGYLEVKTPLIYDLQTLWITSGHWEKYRENMFLIRAHEGEQPMALKPMNCPGHMLLFGIRAALATATCRSATRRPLDAPPRRARRDAARATCASGTSRRTTRTSSAPRTRSRARSTRMIDYVRYLYDRFGVTPRAELSTRPGEAARHRRAVGPRRGRARGRRSSGTE